ncbi:hypothetical protein [Burkholderia ubonensis]|uniref:hypothetical protein n=1 Tax=Burkholderia ubonensis TaxID=101571 RepID=UPI00075A45FC|nr:hypothetical protein [Burkholderia ubonensis]KVV12425.1 hypothetical protein WK77_06320 [Burkholderia ubonensis]
MKLDLEGVAKAAYVGFLLIMWAVLDKVGIHDQVLVMTIQGLIAAIVGWHGINRLPGYQRAAEPLVSVATLGGYQPVAGPIGEPPAPRATVTNTFTMPAAAARASDIPAAPSGANP